MFKLFPFEVIAQFTFGLLPVEVFAMILRCLDPKSLLKACAVNKQWARVCRGDSMLRERIRLQIRKEKKDELQMLLNPGSMVTVTRDPSVSAIYGRNGPKRIVMSITDNRRPRSSRENGGGPMKTKSNFRVQPYRCLRI